MEILPLFKNLEITNIAEESKIVKIKYIIK